MPRRQCEAKREKHFHSFLSFFEWLSFIRNLYLDAKQQNTTNPSEMFRFFQAFFFFIWTRKFHRWRWEIFTHGGEVYVYVNDSRELWRATARISGLTQRVRVSTASQQIKGNSLGKHFQVAFQMQLVGIICRQRYIVAQFSLCHFFLSTFSTLRILSTTRTATWHFQKMVKHPSRKALITTVDVILLCFRPEKLWLYQ